MGLSGLGSALSGLRATNEQLAVVSTNVSNANTEGYSRKILPQSSRVANGQSIGVFTGTLIRNVDLNLERDLWTQVSSAGELNIQKKYLDRVQQFHGPPDAGVNLSAQVTELENEFIKLANDPDNPFTQSSTLSQAERVVDEINGFADFIQQSRNDAQNEAVVVVDRINGLLDRIAQLNTEVSFAKSVDRSSAELEDQRGIAVKELSQYLGIETFLRGDSVLIIQASNGTELASTTAETLTLDPPILSSNLEHTSGSATGVYIGDPDLDEDAREITNIDLGGELGGLITLRDDTLSEMSAQIDEFAHKLALRFDAQGLRLFTGQTGNIPPDTAPDPNNNIPVEYVGFARDIQINVAVSNDPSLLQKGTFNGNLPTGSNEVIARVIDFAFGDTDYMLAQNTDTAISVDIRAGVTGLAQLGAASTIQDWIGVQSQNTVEGNVDLTQYASVSDILNAGGGTVFGTDDIIEFVFDDPDIGMGPYVVQIDLSTIADNPAQNAGQELIAAIEADGDWAAIQADFGTTATLSAQGELTFDSRSDIQIRGAAANAISTAGMSYFGLSSQTSEATDPSFQIQVGDKDPVEIVVIPTDTEDQLLANLNAIEGVAAQIDANGFLSIRPGNDFDDPDFGGSLKIISVGNFTTENAALTGTASGRTTIDDGVNLVSALFGTYSTTGGTQSFSPVENVNYSSATSSGGTSPFRSLELGANVDLNSGVGSAVDLLDFAQKMIAQQSTDLNIIEGQITDAEVLEGLYENELLNQSGVNIDEELSQLILLQTAYAASAQVIQSLEQLFDELLQVF